MVYICWNVKCTLIGVCGQTEYIGIQHPSALFLHILELIIALKSYALTMIAAPAASNITCKHKGAWIHEVVAIFVHFHPINNIGNETRQARQHFFSHQVKLSCWWTQTRQKSFEPSYIKRIIRIDLFAESLFQWRYIEQITG